MKSQKDVTESSKPADPADSGTTANPNPDPDSKKKPVNDLDLGQPKKPPVKIRNHEFIPKTTLKAANWEWDIKSEALKWNFFGQRLFGENEDAIPETMGEFLETISPKDRGRVLNAFNSSLASVYESRIQFEISLAKEDKQILVACCKVNKSDENGSPLSACGIMWETTENEATKLQLENAWLFVDSIVENNPNAIFVKRASDLTFVRFNKANEELLGISKHEVIGRTDHDFFSKEEADFFNMKDREVLKEGRLVVIDEEIINTRHHGRRILCTKKIPIHDEYGNPVYLLGISEDITEKKLAQDALKKSQAQLQAILDNTTSVIYLKDTNFKYITVNRQFEKIFHISREAIVGKVDYDLFPPEMADSFRKNDSDVLHSDKVIQVEESAEQDGELHTYISIKFPINDEKGRVRFIGGISTDITDRKNAENALRNAHDELEERVQKRTAELKSANISLQREINERKQAESRLAEKAEQLTNSNNELQESFSELKDRNNEIKQFYHTVSHELKTPLMATREFISIVSDAIAGEVTDKQKQYLDIAKNGCDKIKTIINDLIDTTRLETGKLKTNLRPFMLKSVVDEVCSIFLPMARDHKVELSWEVDPSDILIRADEQRLAQIFSNLISNAMKHTPEGGSVAIHASYYREAEGFALVTVTDSGVGISSEHLPHIFDRLYQIKRDDLSISGSLGLGLHICRELMRIFEGKIWVESELGSGTTFYLTLPLATAEHPS